MSADTRTRRDTKPPRPPWASRVVIAALGWVITRLAPPEVDADADEVGKHRLARAAEPDRPAADGDGERIVWFILFAVLLFLIFAGGSVILGRLTS